MTFPRNSLRAFLQHAKKGLAQAAHGNQKINIVIGNESAGVYYLPIKQEDNAGC